MQDEVREKSVALVFRVGKGGAKLTAELLKWAIREYQKKANEPPHGKQSMKSLVRQNAGVQNIEITEKNIKTFERVARKYGVDFALKKDPEQKRYLAFFKTRDEAAMDEAFVEYTARTVKRKKEKPSIQKQLSQCKEMVENLSKDKVKNQEKGGREL